GISDQAWHVLKSTAVFTAIAANWPDYERQSTAEFKFKRQYSTARDTLNFAWQARGPGFESPMLHPL
ncbi:MAG TPA: hypothetical protein VKV73_19150, partial [Chloroflexota bacterium]|nr:hypothetical protein [Chloroflexota bacterium]